MPRHIFGLPDALSGVQPITWQTELECPNDVEVTVMARYMNDPALPWQVLGVFPLCALSSGSATFDFGKARKTEARVEEVGGDGLAEGIINP